MNYRVCRNNVYYAFLNLFAYGGRARFFEGLLFLQRMEYNLCAMIQISM